MEFLKYSNLEHQRLDWIGIHEQICSTLGWLRHPQPFIASADERRKHMEKIQDTQVSRFAIIAQSPIHIIKANLISS